MKLYTLGFVFDESLQHVLLIQKNRPEWQAGLLNGLGGKLEKNESFTEGISREVHEEAGILIDVSQWIPLGEMKGNDWQVEVFAAVYGGQRKDVKSVTDEEVSWHESDNLPQSVISNLTWLVPFAIDKLKNEQVKNFSVKYL